MTVDSTLDKSISSAHTCLRSPPEEAASCQARTSPRKDKQTSSWVCPLVRRFLHVRGTSFISTSATTRSSLLLLAVVPFPGAWSCKQSDALTDHCKCKQTPTFLTHLLDRLTFLSIHEKNNPTNLPVAHPGERTRETLSSSLSSFWLLTETARKVEPR